MNLIVTYNKETDKLHNEVFHHVYEEYNNLFLASIMSSDADPEESAQWLNLYYLYLEDNIENKDSKKYKKTMHYLNETQNIIDNDLQYLRRNI